MARTVLFESKVQLLDWLIKANSISVNHSREIKLRF